MDELATIPTVTHVIQQALTPVFLLGGVGAILNVLTSRLARVVDRFRYLNELDKSEREKNHLEMLSLPTRANMIHLAIILCTVCGLLVCISIVILFLGAELKLNVSRIISVLFILAMLALTWGLLYFLREIALATGVVEKFKNH